MKLEDLENIVNDLKAKGYSPHTEIIFRDSDFNEYDVSTRCKEDSSSDEIKIVFDID